jgi:hypothetical protein
MQDVFVNQLQRAGTDAGLAPGQAAVVFDASLFTVSDEPDTVVTGPNGETIEGVTRVSMLSPPGPTTGTCATADATTVTPLVSFAIPTGFCAWVTLTMTGKITSGGGAGQRIAWQELLLFRNLTGTPALSTGTPSQNPPATIGWDETSGALDLTALRVTTFSANTVTLSVVGIASTTVKWGATVQPLYFAE